MAGFTLEQLQNMGAQPIANTPTNLPAPQTFGPNLPKQGLTLQELQAQGAKVDTRQDRINKGLPVGRKRATPTMGGDIVRDVFVRPFARVAAGLHNIPGAVRGEEQHRLRNNYLGTIKPVGEGFDVTKMDRESGAAILDAAGTGAKIASLIPAGSGVGAAVSGTKPLLRKFGQVAAREAVSGGMFGLGEGLEEGKSAGEVALDAGIGALGGAVTGPLLGGVGAGGRALAKPIIKKLSNLTEKAAVKNISSIIKEGIERGIRPTTRGRQTHKLSTRFNKQAEDGITAIVDNSENLQIIDANTGEVSTRLPQNNMELPQAVEQTRVGIWKRMEEILFNANKKASVDVSKAVSILEEASKNPGILPKTRKYAESQIAEIQELQDLPPSVIQERIAAVNERLSSYFGAKDPKFAGNAKIDVMVLRELEEALAATLKKANEPGIGPLKSKYAGLETLKTHVQNAANKESKAIANAFPGGDPQDIGIIMYGVLTGNPGLIASAGTGQLIRFIKRVFGDAGRSTKQMFEGLAEIKQKYPDLFQTKLDTPETLLLPEGKKGVPSIQKNVPPTLPAQRLPDEPGFIQ